MNRRVTPAAEKRKVEAAPKPPSAERHAQPRVGLHQWLLLHRRAARDALSRLLARKLAALMGLLLIGLALALPLMLATLSRNLDRLVGQLQSSGEIAAFLKPELDAAAAQAFAARIGVLPGIAALSLRTPADGLTELQAVPGIADAINAVGANPLPYLLLVQPSDEARARGLADDLATMPEVDQVQYDRQWRDRLQYLLDLLHRLAGASLLLFGLAALLVIGNHVRVEVALRREEIGVVKLLGASDGFVQRPFLWSGFLLGAFGALLAVAITALVRAYFAAPVQALAASYESEFTLLGPDPAMLLTTLACGLLLGSFGAFLATSLQLASDRAH